MQVIITDPRLARSRVLHFTGWQLSALILAAALAVALLALGAYHWILLRGAQENWPVVGQIVRWVVRDEAVQRDRYLKDNLDLMAQRLGELQAKLVHLESLGERVAGLAGLGAAAAKSAGGAGGRWVPAAPLSLGDVGWLLDDLSARALRDAETLGSLESRLFEQRMREWVLPTQSPLPDALLGSAFGWRPDPVTGRSALHTGQDYPAAVGTPILAAAGGMVVGLEHHPEYGLVLELDHGNRLVTRYAHLNRAWVGVGDLVKKGQKIAEVGNSGRSTGPHLHFEVLYQGSFQDPQKFLARSAHGKPPTVSLR